MQTRTHAQQLGIHKTLLNNGWQVTDLAPAAQYLDEAPIPNLGTSAWLDVPVPGDVNAVLVAAGKMPDPHIADNARQCYWVTSREWWYKLEFWADDAMNAAFTDLCLDGLDGHVDIYLNSVKIGHTENAFRSYKFDVAQNIKRNAANVLLLKFCSIDQTLKGPRHHELSGWNNWRALMRKPQFSFGWDWSLPLPSIGIAGSVWLEHHNGFYLEAVSVKTNMDGRLDFKFQVTRDTRDAGYEMVVKVNGHSERLEKRLEPGRVFSHVSMQIENPQLWWPLGMGEQPLYEYEVELFVGDVVVDRKTGRVGIRESRILEEPFTPEAGPGISFWLEINGERVFCKGGNWIPPELWPATATDEQYRFYLQKAADANFNMLRIWGGGIYERDVFYDLCDQLGIMVWQDFMFSGSAGYPLDILRDEIIAEASHQIKRLRNHSSIVLWCGCNEDIYSWELPGDSDVVMASSDKIVPDDPSEPLQVDRYHDDPQLYSMILRGLVSKYGLGIPYIESSPQSYEDAGNLPESGNAHLSCWKYSLFETDGHHEKFREHFEKVCSFDSEFCIQGPCDEWTMRKFLTKDHCWPPDDIWIYHIQRGHANLPHCEQTISIAGAIFGEIDSLQKYVKYGQATHVEMMRAEFESARRDRPNNGGTMMWMFNDCWPTSNWSIIDYYRRPKPSYYAAKRACVSQLPIIFERGGRVEFFFSNDGRKPCHAEVVFGQEKLDGSSVWTRSDSLKAGGCDTVQFYSIDRSALEVANGDYLFIDASVDGIQLPRVTYFPNMWRNVEWPVPNISLDVLDQRDLGTEFVTRVKVTTDSYARMCHLIVQQSDAWLDDNFFDLTAGHSHIIEIHSLDRIQSSSISIGHWHTCWP